MQNGNRFRCEVLASDDGARLELDAHFKPRANISWWKMFRVQRGTRVTTIDSQLDQAQGHYSISSPSREMPGSVRSDRYRAALPLIRDWKKLEWADEVWR